MASRYEFLVDTYETERLKVLSVWAMAPDDALDERPRVGDRRGRTLREHMVHQLQSEHGWFTKMLGIEAPGDVLPSARGRLDFLQRYADASAHRLAALRERDDAWWQGDAQFFEVRRSRAWIVTRRIAHTAHHRGQQTAMLRAAGGDLHSTYGPTADTGGLPKDGPAVVYPYGDVASLLDGERSGGRRAPLPAPVDRPVTELPE